MTSQIPVFCSIGTKKFESGIISMDQGGSASLHIEDYDVEYDLAMAEFGEDRPVAELVKRLRVDTEWFMLEHLEASHALSANLDPVPGAFAGERFSIPVGLSLCEIATCLLKMLPRNADTDKAISDLGIAKKFWHAELPRDSAVDTFEKIKYSYPWLHDEADWCLLYRGCTHKDIKILGLVADVTRIAHEAMFYCYYSTRREVSPGGIAGRTIDAISGFYAIEDGLHYKHSTEEHRAVARREVLGMIFDTFEGCLDDGQVLRYFLTTIPDWAR